MIDINATIGIIIAQIKMKRFKNGKKIILNVAPNLTALHKVVLNFLI
jgi:hypothetical protein